MSHGTAGATFDDVLGEHVAGRHDRLAMVCGDHRYTWEALADRVDAVAAMLAGIGVSEGDRVAWLAQNCHRYLEALLACARLGAVLCPLNWRQRAAEARFVLDDADPVVVLWQEAEIGPLVDELRSSAAAPNACWIGHDDTSPEGYEARVERAPGVGAAEADPEAAVLLLYTAAFDGRPNGALLPQRSLLIQALYGVVFGGATPSDVYLNAGPLFHVGTLKATLATFLAGGTNVFVPRVEADELCRLIERERCTAAFLQPPTIDAMVEVNRDAKYDISSLRAKPGPDAWNAMISPDSSTTRYRSGYGQTELGGVVTFVDADDPCVGSTGRAAPLARVEVVDGDGRAVAAGEVGEIVVRGPMTMTGYHRRPELSAHRARGGWHHTSDLGRRESDGSISFVGPLSRIIKSAAENIYPAEVEGALRAHPQVREAAVIGTPDDRWGQRVLAVVVAAGDAPAAEELVEHCRSRIASYKKPSEVVFVDALPRRDGAVDYDAIDAAFGGGGYPGGANA